jgi:metal-responsive CopG/Arc/MetJ family transcriptional regulator
MPKSPAPQRFLAKTWVLEEDHKKLEDLSKELDLSRSDIIRLAIREYLNKK